MQKEYDPDDLEAKYLTAYDVEVRQTNFPERLLLQGIRPLEGAPPSHLLARLSP